MRQPRTKKTFDCVRMKRKGARRIYEAIKGMTPEQEKAYWRRMDEDFLKRQEQRQTKAPTSG
jgi:methylphosphotriester-DNA--protein-cysteine methyltransferase